MYTPYKMMGSTHYGKPLAKKMLSKAQKTLPTELKEKMVDSGERSEERRVGKEGRAQWGR